MPRFPTSRYFDFFYEARGGPPQPTILFFPEYYRTMAVRLMTLGGAAYVPERVTVVSWAPTRLADGQEVKMIVARQTFPTYEDAQAFLASAGPGNHTMVGRDPAEPCVPLERLQAFRQVYPASPTPGGATRPTVRVFERVEAATRTTDAPASPAR